MNALAIPSLCLAAVVARPFEPLHSTPHPCTPHNVVLLLADDVGVDLVGAYERFYADHPPPGVENITPCIDHLAETGLSFTNAWTNPWCSPTRAQILTGTHARRTGIGNIVTRHGLATNIGLQLFHDTIPSVLRGAPRPYASACVGKWHLADETQFPPSPGGAVHPLGCATNPWFDLYAGPINNLTDHNLWLKTFATTIRPGLDECTPPVADYCQAVTNDYSACDTADDAIHLIKTLPEPFFLYVPFNAAHKPLDKPVVRPEVASCLGGAVQGDVGCAFDGQGPPTQTRCMVQWMDNEIGRILCALESDPEMPELPTTVIFMGDNGTSHDAVLAPFDPEHGKGTLYDGGINVPLIVQSPFVHPDLIGGASAALVCSTDLLATVAQLTGASLPPDPYERRDSLSFVPVLLGLSELGARRFSYAEYFPDNFVPQREGAPPAGYHTSLHLRAIRNVAGFKLIQKVSFGTGGTTSCAEELYFLPRDPLERHDLIGLAVAGTSPYAENYAELRAELDTKYPHLVR